MVRVRVMFASSVPYKFLVFLVGSKLAVLTLFTPNPGVNY